MAAWTNICFTLIPWTEEGEQHLLKSFGEGKIQYMIYGYEYAPTTGTKHLQGYLELQKRTKQNTIKKIVGNSVHIESRKGSQSQAVEYCKKDGIFEEHGILIPDKQGKRNDLDAVRQIAINDGMREVTAFANHQQIKVAEKFLEYNEIERDWKPNVIWITGPSGSGKSRRAREIFEGLDFYTKSDANLWWPGYDAHSCVILDDFRDSWWPLTEMLSLLDRYGKRVQFKGGYRQFLAETIIITSIFGPNDMYKRADEDAAQLRRRIDQLIELPALIQKVPEVPVPEVRG